MRLRHRRAQANGAFAAWVALLMLVLPMSTQATEIAWVWHSSDAPSTGYQEAAVLMESLVLRGTGVERMPRSRALVLPQGVKLTPVIHVQAGSDAPDRFTPAQNRALLEAVQRQARHSTSGWLQLDFEAPTRQRRAYLALAHQIRQQLPASLKLSVTVLLGWCAQGDWLNELAADELVPMLYRLGPAAGQWRARWSDPGAAWHTRCRAAAAGYALQEPPDAAMLEGVARRYWFNERNWPRVLAPSLR